MPSTLGGRRPRSVGGNPLTLALASSSGRSGRPARHASGARALRRCASRWPSTVPIADEEPARHFACSFRPSATRAATRSSLAVSPVPAAVRPPIRASSRCAFSDQSRAPSSSNAARASFSAVRASRICSARLRTTPKISRVRARSNFISSRSCRSSARSASASEPATSPPVKAINARQRAAAASAERRRVARARSSRNSRCSAASSIRPRAISVSIRSGRNRSSPGSPIEAARVCATNGVRVVSASAHRSSDSSRKPSAVIAIHRGMAAPVRSASSSAATPAFRADGTWPRWASRRARVASARAWFADWPV